MNYFKRIIFSGIICMLLSTALLAAAVFAEPANNPDTTEPILPDTNWSDNPQILLDNVLYNVPISIGKLLENGWQYQESPKKTVLEPYSVDSATLYMTKKEYLKEDPESGFSFNIEVMFPMNPDPDQEKPLEECYAQVISIDPRIPHHEERTFEKYPSVVLSSGITYGSPLEDVLDVFGEPSMARWETIDVSYNLDFFNGNGEYHLIVDLEEGLSSIKMSGGWDENRAE